MRCRNCGKELKANERFCLNCGTYNEPSNNFQSNVSDEENLLEEDNLLDDDDSQDTLFDEDTPTDEDTILDDGDNTNYEDLDLSSSNKKSDSSFFNFQDSRLLEAYIGEDYKVVVRKKINIYALLLSYFYFLYRKLYLIGILGLILTGIVIKYFTKYIIIYIVLVMILSGILFNPIYLTVVKKRVLKIKEKEKYQDDFSLEQICAKKGGVTFIAPIVIYALFLIVMFLSMYDVIFPKHENKYFQQNSENEASCTSLVRNVYTNRKSLQIEGDIKQGACNIINGTNKDYNIYIKINNNGKTYYLYLKTKDNYLEVLGNTSLIESLEEKIENKTISQEEETFLNNSKSIESRYKAVETTSKTEDNLIKNNKATSEKLNYIIDEESIKR